MAKNPVRFLCVAGGIAAWLAGAWVAGGESRPFSSAPQRMPAVSGNNWGQHVPRVVPSKGRAPKDEPVVATGRLRANRVTPWTPDSVLPQLPQTSHVDPTASVIGDVRFGPYVWVAPFVSVRADEGAPIHIGSESNLQDAVVVHGLVGHTQNPEAPTQSIEIDGAFYSVYVSSRVSVEHQAQIHGPAFVGEGVWVGMQALVSGSRIGRGVVIEPRATVLGVNIPAHRYVPAGVVVNRQDIADQLPEITAAYPLRRRNEVSLRASRALTDAHTQTTP